MPISSGHRLLLCIIASAPTQPLSMKHHLRHTLLSCPRCCRNSVLQLPLSPSQHRKGTHFSKYTCELPLLDTTPKGCAMSSMANIADIGKSNKKGKIILSARTVEKKFSEWLFFTNLEEARRECTQVKPPFSTQPSQCCMLVHVSCTFSGTHAFT